ncbi:hypothetical protein FQN60_010571 [Etheostoma spectabile]|uniref:Uncharacterized protein n=1 Tax=Etheostoma spectabile TaxID=54343 RepID=A0A5J5CBJ4_9PERO|nr:hypothetical protein FQN60_010571 [Etheostoma spectabile]
MRHARYNTSSITKPTLPSANHTPTVQEPVVEAVVALNGHPPTPTTPVCPPAHQSLGILFNVVAPISSPCATTASGGGQRPRPVFAAPCVPRSAGHVIPVALPCSGDTSPACGGDPQPDASCRSWALHGVLRTVPSFLGCAMGGRSGGCLASNQASCCTLSGDHSTTKVGPGPDLAAALAWPSCPSSAWCVHVPVTLTWCFIRC